MDDTASYGQFNVTDENLLENLFIDSDDEDFLTIDEGALASVLSSRDDELMQMELEAPALDLPPPEMPAASNGRFSRVTTERMDFLYQAHQAPSTRKNTSWGLKIFQGLHIIITHLYDKMLPNATRVIQ